MISGSKAVARLWNLMPLPFEKMAAEVYEDSDRVSRRTPINKICDRLDWEDPLWLRVFMDLGYTYRPARMHRKEWEFTQGVYGLRALGRLSPEASALGLGCGHEPIIYFLATRLRRVVATDLYEGDFSGREADPRVLAQPELFAPHAYPRERLTVRRMDATRIDEPAESHDIVFSFSSLEHFGSRAEQAQCLAEIARVLKPGGVAVITTELILNTFGRHSEYFRRRELLEDLIPGSGLQLAGGEFDFSVNRSTFDVIVDIPEEIEKLPHLILRRWRTYFTSCALFLEKSVGPGTPETKIAARGEEAEVELQPMFRATINILEAPETVGPRQAFSIRCRVENTGSCPWRFTSPDGIGIVRLGAHLLSEDGTVLIRDFGRADLPRDLPIGEDTTLAMNLSAPQDGGSYRIALDMVTEGVRWFSDQITQVKLQPTLHALRVG